MTRRKPRKFTPERRKAILREMEAGVAMSRAAKMHGVDHSTVRDWIRKGLEDHDAGKATAYASFAVKAEEHRAAALARAEKHVYERAQTDDEMARWLLERRIPEEFGRTDRLKVQIDTAVQELLDEIQPHVSEGAFDELVSAIVRVRGIDLGELGEEQAATVH